MAAPFGAKNWNLFRHQILEPISVPKMGTCFGTKNWNLFRYQNLEPNLVPKMGTYFGAQNWSLKILVFETFAESQAKSLCAATWAATTIHPHSCAQPRAQLLEACA